MEKCYTYQSILTILTTDGTNLHLKDTGGKKGVRGPNFTVVPKYSAKEEYSATVGEAFIKLPPKGGSGIKERSQPFTEKELPPTQHQ